MNKQEMIEMILTELTEEALVERRRKAIGEEKELYQSVERLSVECMKILEKLDAEDRQVMENYMVGHSTVADHECRYLYVQGVRDCVELLKKLDVL